MNKPYPKILAIIPCYNESEAISKLLHEFRSLDFFIDTLVVDDGSQDSTYEIANQLSTVVRHSENRGVAAAIKTGIRYAIDGGYDYCIQIDGDGQHAPSEIANFLDHLCNPIANVYIGSRYSKSFWYSAGSIPRRFGCLLVSIFLVLLFNVWLRDPLSGMRLMDKRAMELLYNELTIERLDAEMIPLALQKNLIVHEIPIKIRQRDGGVSHVRGYRGVVFLLKLLSRMLLIRINGN